MRKLFTFLSAFMLSTIGFAQLQNGGFETWDNTSITDPTGMYTSNFNSIKKGLNRNVKQFTPSFTGNYAVKLQTKANATDTVFAFLSNSVNPNQAQGGTPFTDQPDSFICHVQTGLQVGDSAIVMLIFKKSGSTIGMDVFKISGNNSTWQRKAFKIATLTMAPDTIIFGIASSNVTAGTIIPNSFIVFDDISFTSATPIDNGGFENWSTIFSMDTPQNWSCGSGLGFALDGNGIPIEKTTDKYEGQYALKMKTMAGPNNSNFCGINNGNWNGNLMQYMGGFPFTNAVDTLQGWYKYTPKVTGHQCSINIQFKKAGITYGFTGLNFPAASIWTKFEIPFNLTPAPDSAIITINSSNTPLDVADTGSVLIIDAIKFNSMIVGINTFQPSTSILIGPNPTTSEFSIFYVPKNTGKVSYTIFDEAGNVVKNEKLNDLKTTINLSGHPKGVYFVKIYDGENVLNKKVVLQ